MMKSTMILRQVFVKRVSGLLVGMVCLLMTPAVFGQTFDFCYDCFGTTGDCAFPEVADNPDLTALCSEMEIILIIDESGSLDSFAENVQEAVLIYVNALVESGVRMAVIEFDSMAQVVTDYQTVDNAFLQNMTGYFNDVPFNGQTYSPFGTTSWMAAMQVALELEPSDLILFFTDGNPTIYTTENGTTSRCGNGLTTQRPEIVNPMLMANYSKEIEGTHMFMMGVGLVDSVNLERMSGTTRWEVAGDFQESDYALSNFETLAAELRGFAIEICGTEAEISLPLTPDSLCVGEVVQFTYELTNTGQLNPAQNTILRDTFPLGFTDFMILSGTGACIGAGCVPPEPPNVLVWTPGNIAPQSTATLVIQATVGGAGTFVNTAWVTGQNIDDVTASSTVFSVVVPTVNVTAEGQTICTGQSTVLTASATGGFGSYDFEWSTGDVTTEITVSPLVTTTYSVTVTDAFGCSDVDEIVVTVQSLPDVEIPGVDTSCFGLPVVLNPNGDPNFQYAWSPPELLNDPTVYNPIATVSETTTFTVTITDNTIAQCQTTQTVTVVVPPDIELGAPADTSYCEDAAITLTATGVGLDYTWFTDDGVEIGTGPVITLQPDEETTYIIEGRDVFGCEVQTTVTLNPTFLDLTPMGDELICRGETSALSVQNNTPGQNLTYLWTPQEGIVGPNNNSTVIVMPFESTTYSVVVTETEVGCTDTFAFDVFVSWFDPEDLVIFIESDTINLTESFVLSTNQDPDLFYFWDGPGIENPNSPIVTGTPLSTGIYTYVVTVTNQHGCVLTGSISNLTVLDPLCSEADIFIPDAFSPNNDGQNDMLFVYGNFITALELRIFNRWGEQVFVTNDQNIGWDGTFEGKELTPDVFGYYLRVECPPDKRYFTKGNITLFK